MIAVKIYGYSTPSLDAYALSKTGPHRGKTNQTESHTRTCTTTHELAYTRNGWACPTPRHVVQQNLNTVCSQFPDDCYEQIGNSGRNSEESTQTIERGSTKITETVQPHRLNTARGRSESLRIT